MYNYTFHVGQLVAASSAGAKTAKMKQGALVGMVLGYRHPQGDPEGFSACARWKGSPTGSVIVLSKDRHDLTYFHPEPWRGRADKFPVFHWLRSLREDFLSPADEAYIEIPREVGLRIKPTPKRPYGLRVELVESGSANRDGTTPSQWYCRDHNEEPFRLGYWDAVSEGQTQLGLYFGDELLFSLPPLGKAEEAKLQPLPAGSTVIISDPSRIPGLNGNTARALLGVPAICMTNFDGHLSAVGVIQVAGGRGGPKQMNTSRSALSPTPDYWVMPGEKVEVVAPVSFKRRQLSGEKGKVVMYPDSDGDAGVEFDSDLGAGSLDGLGKDGHCLFVPAKALKKV